MADNSRHPHFEAAVMALAAVLCPEATPADGWPPSATVPCWHCQQRAADIITEAAR